MVFTSSACRYNQPRRGVIVVLAALLLIVVFAMIAFAVDIGVLCHADAELQRTADACAMAAVQSMPDETQASLAAHNMANKNRGTEGPELSSSDIVYGSWDRDTAIFTPNDPRPNAVQVTVMRVAKRGTAVQLFFADVVGTSETDVWANAIAMYDNSLCGPLVGIDWIEVAGDPRTDSYKSSRGAYADQPSRDHGSLCSDGPINIDGTAYVGGDANAGRNYQTTLTGGAIVTGNISPRMRPLNLPPVEIGSVEFSNDNDKLPPIKRGRNWVEILDANRNFILDGGRSYTMPAGTYYLNDLILTGSSTLTIKPNVNIYLTGRLDTSGGDLINSSQDPNSLRIFMTGETARIAGSSDNYMVVYAPNTQVEVTGDSHFYGAVVGKTLAVSGNPQFHYDEDLKLDDALNMPKRVSLVQ